MYLICDNDYLTWPTTICPHTHFDSTTLEGFFLTNLERHNVRVGRGGPLENDGIWLSGNTATDHDVETNTILASKFVRRCAILAMHLRVLRDIGPIVYEVDGEGE